MLADSKCRKGTESSFESREPGLQMGLTVSFQRSSRKTGPLSIANGSSACSVGLRQEAFDDIALHESNPFLNSGRKAAVPHSLKQFVEDSGSSRELLAFYADVKVSNMTVSNP